MGEDNQHTAHAQEEGEAKPDEQEPLSSDADEAADADDLSCVAELGYD